MVTTTITSIEKVEKTANAFKITVKGGRIVGTFDELIAKKARTLAEAKEPANITVQEIEGKWHLTAIEPVSAPPELGGEPTPKDEAQNALTAPQIYTLDDYLALMDRVRALETLVEEIRERVV